MPNSGEIHNPADRVIPWYTRLTTKQIPLLKQSIKWRERKLGIAYLDISTSIWLMCELEHLRKMLKFNLGLSHCGKGNTCGCS